MAYKKSTIDKYAMTFIFLVSLVIFIFACLCASKIPDGCSQGMVHDSLTAIMVISGCLCASSITYALCLWAGHNCYVQNSDYTGKFYVALAGFFSFLLTLFAGMLAGTITNASECTTDSMGNETDDGKLLKIYVWCMFIICLLSLLSIVFASWYIKYKIPHSIIKQDKADILPKI
jgi:hypothetical protein